MRSRSCAPKNAKLRLLRHKCFVLGIPKVCETRACIFTEVKKAHLWLSRFDMNLCRNSNYITITFICKGKIQKNTADFFQPCRSKLIHFMPRWEKLAPYVRMSLAIKIVAEHFHKYLPNYFIIAFPSPTYFLRTDKR